MSVLGFAGEILEEIKGVGEIWAWAGAAGGGTLNIISPAVSKTAGMCEHYRRILKTAGNVMTITGGF